MFRFRRFQCLALTMVLASTLASVPAAHAQSAESFSLNTLATFSGDTGAYPGIDPDGTLIQASDGNFYGTTASGGSENYGTIFRLTPSGTYTVLYNFLGPVAVGVNPNSGLYQGADGALYGTTSCGAGSGSVACFGSVFRITTLGQFSVLHTFQGGTSDGAYPYSGVVQGPDGNFYGTTYEGGAHNLGTVYKLTPTGTVTLLHSFNNGNDGGYILQGLLLGNDGNFYGTSTLEGPNNYGTIFQISPTGTFVTLYSFNLPIAAYPQGTLIQGTDGYLYGATGYDGGTVFRLTTAGTGFTALYNFQGTPGSSYLTDPQSLVLGSDGNLYGIADFSNNPSGGGLFQINPSTSAYSDLLDFNNGASQNVSAAGLLQGSDGNFYGVTIPDGVTIQKGGYGTIFQLAATPALPAPVQLSVSATSYGEPVSVTYSVLNAPPLTSASTPGQLNQCELYIDGSPAASLIGTPTAAIYELTTAQLAALSVGSHQFALTCGGTESSKPVSVTIAPATLTFTAQSQSFVYGSVLPTPTYTVSGLQFGQTLSSFVSGQPSLAAVGVTLTSNVGVYPLAINLGGLICSSPCNYQFQFVNGTITVEPATPVINWPTPPAITYGTGLPAADLNATAYGIAGTGGTPLPGNFVYTETAGTVFHAGQNPLGAAFFPNSPNYAPVSAYTFLTVNQATPVITWPNPASIPYGTPLSSVQLNATANVPGTFFYVAQGVGLNPAGAVLPAGLSALGAGFTPADGLDYAPVSAFALLDVTQQNTSLSILDSFNTATSTGGTATLSVNLAPAGGLTQGKAVPTGSILYLDGGNVIGSGPVGQGISHSLTLGKGTHYLAAVYTGDNNYVSSGSNIVVVTF